MERIIPGFWRVFVGAANRALLELHQGGADVVVTSWWRGPAFNSEIGGASGSQHLVGAALDVAGPNAAIFSAFSRQGFVCVDEGSHVHVQTWPAGVLARSGVLNALYA